MRYKWERYNENNKAIVIPFFIFMIVFCANDFLNLKLFSVKYKTIKQIVSVALHGYTKSFLLSFEGPLRNFSIIYHDQAKCKKPLVQQ